MSSLPTFAVIGEGKGGLATAGGLAINGCTVNLLAQAEFEGFLDPIKHEGGLRVTGVLGERFVRLGRVTTDIASALEDVDVVVVVVDAGRQKHWAELCAPHLKSGQVVLLHPGNGGGALEFAQSLRESGTPPTVPVAETAGFFYVNRRTGPASIEISALKQGIPTAAFPGDFTEAVMRLLNPAFQGLAPAANVIETSLSNINHLMHPCQVIFNVGRIEDTKGDFGLYTQAVTPSVARYIEMLDMERLEVGQACGLSMPTFRELLLRFYGSQGAHGSTVHEVMHSFSYYQASRAKPNINNRLLTEDVPYGIVFIASLGRLLGVPTPGMDAIVTIASTLLETDMWRTGRMAARAGLAGMDAVRIREYVSHGV